MIKQVELQLKEGTLIGYYNDENLLQEPFTSNLVEIASEFKNSFAHYSAVNRYLAELFIRMELWFIKDSMDIVCMVDNTTRPSIQSALNTMDINEMAALYMKLCTDNMHEPTISLDEPPSFMNYLNEKKDERD